MAATFVSGSSASGGSGTTLTVPAPSGIVAGNLLVAALYNADDHTSPTYAAPSGWTVAGPTVAGAGDGTAYSAGLLTSLVGGAAVFTKVATSSEPASYLFTGPAYLAGAVVQYANAAGLDGVPRLTSMSGGSSATYSAPAATATSASDVLLTFYSSWNGNAWSTPSGGTLRASAANPGNTSLYLFEEPVTAVGATPAYASTQSNPQNTVAGALLLSPASIPVTPAPPGPYSGVSTPLPYDLHAWAPVVQSTSGVALTAPLSASGAAAGVSTRQDPGTALTVPLTAAAGAARPGRSGPGAATVLPLTAAAGDGIVIATSLSGTGDSILLPFTTGNGVAVKHVNLHGVELGLLLVDIQGSGLSVRQDSGVSVSLGLQLTGDGIKIAAADGLAVEMHLILPAQARGTRYEWTFQTPTDQDYQPFSPIYPNLLYYGIPYGMTVWQDADGEWQRMRGPNPKRLIGATRIYEGGRLHVLSADDIAALSAAGYADNIILQEMH